MKSFKVFSLITCFGIISAFASPQNVTVSISNSTGVPVNLSAHIHDSVFYANNDFEEEEGLDINLNNLLPGGIHTVNGVFNNIGGNIIRVENEFSDNGINLNPPVLMFFREQRKGKEQMLRADRGNKIYLNIYKYTYNQTFGGYFAYVECDTKLPTCINI